MTADIQIFNPTDQRFDEQQEEMLRAPLDINRIKHRPGAGSMQLKYIKGDDAIDTANRIFGFGRWGYKVINRGHEVVETKNGLTDVYTADVELYVVGAVFPFPGDGMGIVGKPFSIEMHEKARKEATTDALKRALRHYGDQFGLSLYCEDDYVAADDGSLVKVSEVKPGRPQQPKRVVESQAQPKQISQAEDALKARLRGLFERAKALGLLPEPSLQGFLRMASLATKEAITESSQLSQDRLDAIESYINNKEAITAQLAESA